MKKAIESMYSLRKFMNLIGKVVNTFYNGMKINLMLESSRLFSALTSLLHRANADGALLLNLVKG